MRGSRSSSSRPESSSRGRWSRLPGHSWDLHLSDLDRVGPLGHEPGEERERLARAGGLHPPPDAVVAGQAARGHVALPQRAAKALPGGKGCVTFVRLMAVVEEEERHAAILSPAGLVLIGRPPRNRGPE